MNQLLNAWFDNKSTWILGERIYSPHPQDRESILKTSAKLTFPQQASLQNESLGAQGQGQGEAAPGRLLSWGEEVWNRSFEPEDTGWYIFVVEYLYLSVFPLRWISFKYTFVGPKDDRYCLDRVTWGGRGIETPEAYQAGWGLLHVRSLNSSLLGFDLLTHPCLALMTPRAGKEANLTPFLRDHW